VKPAEVCRLGPGGVNVCVCVRYEYIANEICVTDFTDWIWIQFSEINILINSTPYLTQNVFILPESISRSKWL